MENTLCCWAMLSLSQGLSSFPCSASEQVHKRLGGSIAPTADPKWPKGYSIPENVTNSIETGRSQSLLGDGLGIRQQTGSNCVVHRLLLFSFSLLFLSPFC